MRSATLSSMPRQARFDAAGILYHVMIRGIERRKIFKNDEDRNDLVDRLAPLVPETKTVRGKGIIEGRDPAERVIEQLIPEK
jgi:hypothetical protein